MKPDKCTPQQTDHLSRQRDKLEAVPLKEYYSKQKLNSVSGLLTDLERLADSTKTRMDVLMRAVENVKSTPAKSAISEEIEGLISETLLSISRISSDIDRLYRLNPDSRKLSEVTGENIKPQTSIRGRAYKRPQEPNWIKGGAKC
jgi:hypothetical protein